MTLTEDELARPLTAEEEAQLRQNIGLGGVNQGEGGSMVQRLLATLDAARSWRHGTPHTHKADGEIEWLRDTPVADEDDPEEWRMRTVKPSTVTPVADTAGIDAAPEPLCGCGHDAESHFPACLAPAPIKPHVEFASPLVIEGETMRRVPNYICGCPAFGSPAGASLGKRRAKNAAALRTPKPEGELE